MMVDEKKTKLTSKHGDKTFYFCSASCKTSFDKDSHRYGPYNPVVGRKPSAEEKRLSKKQFVSRGSTTFEHVSRVQNRLIV
jgi:YHS domain-containing protein